MRWMWCPRNGRDVNVEEISRNGSHRDREAGGSIAARHVLLVPIEKTDSMMALSVALAGQTGERFETAQLRSQLIRRVA